MRRLQVRFGEFAACKLLNQAAAGPYIRISGGKIPYSTVPSWSSSRFPPFHPFTINNVTISRLLAIQSSPPPPEGKEINRLGNTVILPYRTVSCRHNNVNSIRPEVKALSARHHPHPRPHRDQQLQPRIGSIRPFFATQLFRLFPPLLNTLTTAIVVVVFRHLPGLGP